MGVESNANCVVYDVYQLCGPTAVWTIGTFSSRQSVTVVMCLCCFFSHRGRFGAVIMGSFALYNIVSSFKGSTDVMGNQRRRVSQPAIPFMQAYLQTFSRSLLCIFLILLY